MHPNFGACGACQREVSRGGSRLNVLRAYCGDHAARAADDDDDEFPAVSERVPAQQLVS